MQAAARLLKSVMTNEKVRTLCKADEKFSRDAAHSIVAGVKYSGHYSHNANADIATDPVLFCADGTYTEASKS